MPKKKTNLIGQVIGFLTVIGDKPSINGRTRWECECECGEFITVLTVNLRSERTQSCNKCSLVRKGRKPIRSLYDGIEQGRRNNLYVYGWGRRGEFICSCTVCGNGHLFAVKGSDLRKRKRVDCGRHIVHDNSHMGKLYRRLYPNAYSSWREMLRRCTDPRHIQFADYGGRGIRVYERWLPSQGGFESFVHWFGASGQSLERTSEQSIDRWPNPHGNYEPGNVVWGTKSEQARHRRPKYDARPRLARRAA